MKSQDSRKSVEIFLNVEFTRFGGKFFTFNLCLGMGQALLETLLHSRMVCEDQEILFLGAILDHFWAKIAYSENNFHS